MAFDPLVGWTTGHEVNSGEAPADGVEAGDGTYSTKDAQHLATLLQEIVDALDYISAN
jgi:hypothetical protein